MHRNGCNSAAMRLQSLEDRVHGRFDCSPLKDRHLDAVTRCASGAEASSLLRKGDVGIDIVLVEVRTCLLELISDDKITGAFWRDVRSGSITLREYAGSELASLCCVV